MKKIMLFILAGALITPCALQAKKVNNAELFFNNLKQLCGNAYEGQEVTESKAFAGEKLVMHVISCEKNEIRIPFFVGENRSRTWVLTLKKDRILLKHDHRHSDGTPEEGNTMYGGLASNNGNANMQVFPADQQTADMLPHTVGNVWWMTVDADSFTYNLRRMGTDRFVSVKFDLKNPVTPPPPPWGWNK